MKYFFSIGVALTLLLSSSIGIAQTVDIEQSWDVGFVKKLEKSSAPDQTDGLGFKLLDEDAFIEAVNIAVASEGTGCECVILAVGLNFNPHSVLMALFKSKAKVDLEQLCLCATETGDSDVLAQRGYEDIRVGKAIMKQAAEDAEELALVTREDVTQAQCLETGLAMTEEFMQIERTDPGNDSQDYSP